MMTLSSSHAHYVAPQRVSASGRGARQPLVMALHGYGRMGANRFRHSGGPRAAGGRSSASRRSSFDDWSEWFEANPQLRNDTKNVAAFIKKAAQELFGPDMRPPRRAQWEPQGWEPQGPTGWKSPDERISRVPLPVDTFETDEAYTIVADTPGVKRKNLKVQAKLDKRQVVVKGERSPPEEARWRPKQQIGSNRLTERNYGTFEGVLQMPEDADLSAVQSRLSEGVLTISVGKIQKAEELDEVVDVTIDGWTDGAEWSGASSTVEPAAAEFQTGADWVDAASKGGPEAASQAAESQTSAEWVDAASKNGPEAASQAEMFRTSSDQASAASTGGPEATQKVLESQASTGLNQVNTAPKSGPQAASQAVGSQTSSSDRAAATSSSDAPKAASQAAQSQTSADWVEAASKDGPEAATQAAEEAAMVVTAEWEDDEDEAQGVPKPASQATDSKDDAPQPTPQVAESKAISPTKPTGGSLQPPRAGDGGDSDSEW